MGGHNLKALREARGWSQAEAAAAFGLSTKGYIKIENGERMLKAEMAKRAAEIYNTSTSDVLALRRTVAVIGYVGAGAEAHFYKDADCPWGEASMPPGGNDNTAAVQLRGTSLGWIFDGWYVYYDDVRTPPDPSMLRQLCVVGLADDRVLVKKLFPGSKPGYYNLVSETEGVIEDVVVEWAALVKALTPG